MLKHIDWTESKFCLQSPGENAWRSKKNRCSLADEDRADPTHCEHLSQTASQRGKPGCPLLLTCLWAHC